MVELPARITGLDPIQCWGSIAIFDTTHINSWFQIQRAAAPVLSVIFDNGQDPSTAHQQQRAQHRPRLGSLAHAAG